MAGKDDLIDWPLYAFSSTGRVQVFEKFWCDRFLVKFYCSYCQEQRELKLRCATKAQRFDFEKTTHTFDTDMCHQTVIHSSFKIYYKTPVGPVF